MNDHHRDIRHGYWMAVGCYLFWGLLPLYFKAMPDVSPMEIFVHRVIWSMVFLVVVAAVMRQLGGLLAPLGQRLVLKRLAISAFLIGLNWLIYISAVAHGHILAASLGYFLNPLFSVGLGVLFLNERLRRTQMVAIALALAGVVLLAFSALDTLWISVGLALTFGLYGLVRKTTPVASLPGLATETLILLPFAAAYGLWQAWQGDVVFGQHEQSTALLLFAGVISSVPLLLFAQAAQRLPLATLGLLQYLTPSIQFVLGAILYGEPLDMAKLASFVLIWIGLAVFTQDAMRQLRGQPASR